MNTQTHSKSMVLPIDERVSDRKAKNLSVPSVLVQKRKLLQALTIWTWMIAVLLSVLFYFALRYDLVGMDWLAGLLLGMVFLGWIVTGYYYRVTDKPSRSLNQEDRYDK
jgi:type VI protein secretion system component VasK